ncbi:PPOX class F420-dependent oxidoreductase [Amycolatopsis panacis]|uniref:PPOX class F420-dependent oxidoreductase n=1 Tax=Amycolatopsis panacis TaxID=2340917 RepID=A0A419HUU4_9PSEU|nr:PPOX class F420-dependent oxidoreductase [Amycolatopsis panacis]RJQ80669.1 PPOX class F420-dependent oxidoreductase [Amycolatopsis panacis]
MPTTMTPGRALAFLAEGTRSAVLATVRPDGRPHAVPLWYAVDGSDVLLNLSRDSVKGRNLDNTPTLALTVHDDVAPYSFVTVEGDGEIVADPAQVRAGAEAIARRYLPAEARDGYVGYAVSPGKVLVRVRPARLTGVDAVAG